MIRRSSVDYRERIAHLRDMSGSICTTAIGGFHESDGHCGFRPRMRFITWQPRAMYRYPLMCRSITADVVATVGCRCWRAVRLCGLTDTCRVYQASTSSFLRKGGGSTAERKTPFHPYSPYAVAKQYGYWIVKEYREAYNMFCCSGILFNHESSAEVRPLSRERSPWQQPESPRASRRSCIWGNLSSLRDWGYAKIMWSACG